MSFVCSVIFIALASLPLSYAAPVIEAAREVVSTKKEDAPSAEDPSLWANLSIAASLVLLGGAFAGLTIALMGQDEIYLQVIATSGEGPERKNAKKVLNLLKKGKHWVLVTLLLGNVITNETLPIILDRSLGGGWPAVLGSTVLIVIFGEIAPQSICVRFGLPIGAFMAPFVLTLMWLLAPIAWPTAKLLDYLLGEDHGTTYKKAGLKTLVTLHRTLGESPGERLNQDEVTIISAVLDLKEKPVGSIMTPMADVFTLSLDTVLDEDMMDNILSEGYSRIPIYAVNNPRDFVGMLLVKMLITYDPEDALRVKDFQLATLPETRPETSCLDIVNFFQEGKSHMVLVSDYPGESRGALGVLTLEDVIEELIGEEIIDESDVFIDVHRAVRRLHPAPFNRVRRADKGEIVTSPDPKADTEQESLLEAYDKDLAVDGRRSRAVSLTEPPAKETRRQSASDMSKSPPGTTFMMRRRSSGGDPLVVRSNNTDIRQHLKHLGPSNSASRPKATRIGTVKIKPGHVDQLATLPETSQLAMNATIRPALASPRVIPRSTSANETTGLLSLSAGHSAKDGVHALSYGALSKAKDAYAQQRQSDGQGDGQVDGHVDSQVDSKDKENNAPRSQFAEDLLTGSPKSQPPSSPNDFRRKSRSPDVAVTPPAKLVIDLSPSQANLANLEASAAAGAASKADRDQRSADRNRRESTSTLGSLPSDSAEGHSKKRHLGTRSGSISEHVIEVGGIKKVILETTSSSDAEEDGRGHGGVSVSHPHHGKENELGASSKSVNGKEADDTEKEGHDGKSAAGKKKRKKKNHKKKAKTGASMGDSQTLAK